MVLLEATEPEIIPEILRRINDTNPRRRDLAKLKIKKRRLDHTLQSYSIRTDGDYMERYFTDHLGFLQIGFDNHFYLTEQGRLKAKLSLTETNLPPEINGQRRLFFN